MQRAQRGEPAAQRELLLRYAGVLRGLVQRVSPGPASEVDELTQAALHRLLEALPKFDVAGSAKLTTRVFSVVHHFLIDISRKRHLRAVPLDEAANEVDVRESPFEVVARSELRTALEDAIALLPTDQRRVFVMAHVLDQPLEIVAQTEGVPVGTIKSRLFRARALLATQLGPHLVSGGHHGND